MLAACVGALTLLGGFDFAEGSRSPGGGVVPLAELAVTGALENGYGRSQVFRPDTVYFQLFGLWDGELEQTPHSTAVRSSYWLAEVGD